ncbi:MAG: hypothetical protein ACLQJL_07065 [Roseiarcus sp.]
MRRDASADSSLSAPPSVRPRALAAAAGLIALAGCAAPAASSKGHMVQYVAGASQAIAFRAADKSCNAYGRAAETVSYDSAAQTLAFRCIEP